MLTELRIGNLIGREDGSVVEVTPGVITSLQFKDEESRMYQALPLTGEWLEKLGFVLSSDETWFFQSNPALELRGKPEYMEVLWEENILFSRAFCVHRLQNLVYELTEVEVMLKEVKDELGEAIRAVADGLLSHYIPADRSAQELSFDLSIEGETYNVSYKRDPEGYWAFDAYNTGYK